MYRALIVLLILLYFTLPVSCNVSVKDYEGTVNGIANVYVHNTYSRSVTYQEIPTEMEGWRGIGIGFVRPEDMNIYPLDRPQTFEFRIGKDDLFNPFLILSNGMREQKTFLVTTILDYSQVNFALDGRESLLHEVTVPAETDMYLPFCLDIDCSGIHDIQVVIFNNPYNTTLDKDFRMDFSGYFVARRAVVILGRNETPARFLNPSITGVPIPADNNYTPFIGFISAPSSKEEPPSSRQLYIGEALAGESFQFQIYLTNTSENETAVYTIIPFLDYHQVNMGDSNIYIANLDPEQEATIDVELTLPQEPNIYQFQALLLFDPYQSVLKGEVFTPIIFSSPRIAIDAR